MRVSASSPEIKARQDCRIETCMSALYMQAI